MFKKDQTYTFEAIKAAFKEAEKRVISTDLGRKHENEMDSMAQMMLKLSGSIFVGEMAQILFEEEEGIE